MFAALLVSAAMVGQPMSVTVNWGAGLGRGHVIPNTAAFNGSYSLSGGGGVWTATDMTKDATGDGRVGVRVVVGRAPSGNWTVALQVPRGVGSPEWVNAGGTYGSSRTLPMIIPTPQFPGDATHFIRVD